VRFPALAILAIAAAVVLASCSELTPNDGTIIPPCVEGDSDPMHTVSFERDIRPLMSDLVPGTKGCKQCHYDDQPSHVGIDAVGLNLTELEYIRKGGVNTKDNILVPGKACDSAIVQKLRGSFHIGARMPRGGPFWTDAQIQLMADWIVEGAQGDDDE